MEKEKYNSSPLSSQFFNIKHFLKKKNVFRIVFKQTVQIKRECLFGICMKH